MTDENDDRDLSARFRALDPHGAAIVRMGDAIDARLARLRRPLWREWLALFTARPAVGALLATAGIAIVLLTTPAGLALGVAAQAVTLASSTAAGSSESGHAALGPAATAAAGTAGAAQRLDPKRSRSVTSSGPMPICTGVSACASGTSTPTAVLIAAAETTSLGK